MVRIKTLQPYVATAVMLYLIVNCESSSIWMPLLPKPFITPNTARTSKTGYVETSTPVTELSTTTSAKSSMVNSTKAPIRPLVNDTGSEQLTREPANPILAPVTGKGSKQTTQGPHTTKPSITKDDIESTSVPTSARSVLSPVTDTGSEPVTREKLGRDKPSVTDNRLPLLESISSLHSTRLYSTDTTTMVSTMRLFTETSPTPGHAIVPAASGLATQASAPISCFTCNNNESACGKHALNIDMIKNCSSPEETCWTIATLKNLTITYTRECAAQLCTPEYQTYNCVTAYNEISDCRKCCSTPNCNSDIYDLNSKASTVEFVACVTTFLSMLFINAILA